MSHPPAAISRQSEPDLARAVSILETYEPPNDEQASLRRRILEWIDRFPETAHRRECLDGHLTASSLVLDPAGRRILLLHHRKLDKWLQPGGHCDGDANLPGVALREAEEETGLDGLIVEPLPIDLDIHEIPARGDVPAHLHLDTRFVVTAPPGVEPRQNHESNAVRWCTLDEAFAMAGDDSVERLVRIAADRFRSGP
ncbi:MAG: NUDIX hydrolase [Acidobacteriota bacterium]